MDNNRQDHNRQAIATFVCPNCQGELYKVDIDGLRCNQCSSAYFCQNGIPLLIPQDTTESLMSKGEDCNSRLKNTGSDDGTNNFAAPVQLLDWENLYRQVAEPWSYSSRAAEILKYRYLLKTSSQLLNPRSSHSSSEHPISGKVIDVGCSFGRLSTDLALKGATVTALDISPTAMHRAKELSDGKKLSPIFGVASCTALPIASGEADLVIIADGLYSYKISIEECRTALAEANRVLKPGGKILLMDYMKPERFDSFVDLVKGNGFEVEGVHLLYDRLFYALEMGLRRFHDKPWCKWLLANIPLAHLLSLLARLLGKAGSSHICVIATKVEILS
jgi:ubiquinone/menaquinone biosynthesis C-methylase UbiE/uncharacterized protein YbaR (Trm112 family)